MNTEQSNSLDNRWIYRPCPPWLRFPAPSSRRTPGGRAAAVAVQRDGLLRIAVDGDDQVLRGGVAALHWRDGAEERLDARTAPRADRDAAAGAGGGRGDDDDAADLGHRGPGDGDQPGAVGRSVAVAGHGDAQSY